MQNEELKLQLDEFISSKKLYRNRGARNLAKILYSVYDDKYQMDTGSEMPPIVEEIVKSNETNVEDMPVMEATKHEAMLPPTIITLDDPKPEEMAVPLLKPELLPPVVELDVESESDEPVEPSPTPRATLLGDKSEDDVSFCPSHLDNESQAPEMSEPDELVKVGAYSYTTKPCEACDKMRSDYAINNPNNKKDTFNYFELFCTKCQKAKYNDWKKQKKQLEQQAKVDANNEKVRVKNTIGNDKVAELQQLKNVRKDGISNNNQFKNDLKKVVGKNNSKFNLNLFIK